MRAYYNPRTHVMRLLEETEKINIRVRYASDMTREDKKAARQLFMSRVIEHPNMAFLDPAARRPGKQYTYQSCGVMGSTMLTPDLVSMGISLVVATIKLSSDTYSSSGVSVTTPFTNAIRRGMIDGILDSL